MLIPLRVLLHALRLWPDDRIADLALRLRRWERRERMENMRGLRIALNRPGFSGGSNS
jgi:hypothetical protein